MTTFGGGAIRFEEQRLSEPGINRPGSRAHDEHDNAKRKTKTSTDALPGPHYKQDDGRDGE